MNEQPIADHCREAAAYLRERVGDASPLVHTHFSVQTNPGHDVPTHHCDGGGHDPGDEDPNAWSIT